MPDTSVTIVTVGFFTNMANLLSSGADVVSPLKGRELVAKKVKRLVSMAGCFDQRMGTFREFNVRMDSTASAVVFNGWPRPILFSGYEIGAGIFTGLPIVRSGVQHSPVKDVFARCIPMDAHDRNGRMSWDETAVLVAVRGAAPYFDVVRGSIVSKPDGSNGWDATGTRDGYLVHRRPPEEIAGIIDNLMMHQPISNSPRK